MLTCDIKLLVLPVAPFCDQMRRYTSTRYCRRKEIIHSCLRNKCCSCPVVAITGPATKESRTSAKLTSTERRKVEGRPRSLPSTEGSGLGRASFITGKRHSMMRSRETSWLRSLAQHQCTELSINGFLCAQESDTRSFFNCNPDLPRIRVCFVVRLRSFQSSILA